MDNFIPINIQDLTSATRISDKDFLPIAQGARDLNKVQLRELAYFFGLKNNFKYGNVNLAPEGQSFVFASEGTYPEWGNITVPEDSVYILIYDGSVFSYVELPIPSININIVDTISDLRNTEGTESQVITLLGYYEAGDKEPLTYKYTTEQGVDDGGAVINTGSGSWVAVFDGSCNVRDFGAKGDNIQNDQPYIQKAIDYSTEVAKNSSYGGGIILSKGNYNITSSIVLKPGVSIKGVSSNEVWIMNRGTGVPAIKGDINYADKGSINYSTLSNFNIYCHPEGVNKGNSGIDAIGLRYCTFRDIRIDVRYGANGITCKPTSTGSAQWYNSLYDIYILGSNVSGAKGGIAIDLGSEHQQATTWTFYGGRVAQCDIGINLYFASSMIFNGMVAEGNNQAFVVGTDDDGVSISRNNTFILPYIEAGVNGFKINTSSWCTNIIAPRTTSASGTFLEDNGEGTFRDGGDSNTVLKNIFNTSLGNRNFEHYVVNGHANPTLEKSTYRRHLIEGQTPAISFRNTQNANAPYVYCAAGTNADVLAYSFNIVEYENSTTPTYTTIFGLNRNFVVLHKPIMFEGGSGVKFASSTDDPEGTLGALNGSLSLRRGGGVDKCAYLKTTGTTNQQSTGWVPIQSAISGTTAQRPTVTTVGFRYFDTTLGKPAWWNGTSWVDGTGTVV